ncbi:MAG: Ryanodine receptor Ryr [Prevotella sp.]|nr:Ryanodine receptor Ryr [Prevotella sp.]
MIQVLQSVEEYEPHPIDVDDIPLDGDLEELQEAIAENAHDVWAEARIKEGWSYGKERDDVKKHNPDIIPYTALSDSEKEYDRIMAFKTIKLVKKLGFDIVKRR